MWQTVLGSSVQCSIECRAYCTEYLKKQTEILLKLLGEKTEEKGKKYFNEWSDSDNMKVYLFSEQTMECGLKTKYTYIYY